MGNFPTSIAGSLHGIFSHVKRSDARAEPGSGRAPRGRRGDGGKPRRRRARTPPAGHTRRPAAQAAARSGTISHASANQEPAGEPAAQPGAGATPSPLEWLCLAAGLVLLLRYAWLMDDAYVYFRYVDNWVFLGHGLVYNRGEYLEGFSSPLWALLLGLLRSSTVGYWILIRLLGVVSFVLIWWALVRLNRRLAPAGAPPVNLPLWFVAFAYGPLCYFTSGLETPLVQVAAPLCGGVVAPVQHAHNVLFHLSFNPHQQIRKVRK